MRPGARVEPVQRTLGTARAREETVRANLALLESEGITDHRYTNALAQLAESLGEQGKFGEAAGVAPDELKSEYERLQAALVRDDTDSCDCPPMVQVNAEGLEVPNQYIERMVYSEKHGRVMPVIKCSCGDLNIKPMPAHLSRIEDDRKKSVT